MTLKNLIAASGASILALALGIVAVPAAAQAADNGPRAERSHRGNHGARATTRMSSGDWNNRTTVRAETRTSQRRSDTRRSDTRRSDTRRANRDYAQRSYQPQQQRARTADRQATRTYQRNRTYTDQRRNSTYVDSRRSQTYRDGYRDGRRTERRYDNRGYDNRRYDNSRRWNRDSWRQDNRYNWYDYRRNNRNIYRLGTYYAPYRGYSYRRLNIGFFLDSIFFSNRYYINDPWRYRLPSAYGRYRWVRYYDDALLVDIYSGEVVDVIYDIFW